MEDIKKERNKKSKNERKAGFYVLPLLRLPQLSQIGSLSAELRYSRCNGGRNGCLKEVFSEGNDRWRSLHSEPPTVYVCRQYDQECRCSFWFDQLPAITQRYILIQESTTLVILVSEIPSPLGTTKEQPCSLSYATRCFINLNETS